MSRRPYPLPLFLLILTLACQLVTPNPPFTASPTEPGIPQPTIPPLLGNSRANPLPSGQIIHTANWEIDVLEFVRGDAAWELLKDNSYNQPPAADEEYVLVQYYIRHTNRNAAEESLGLALTGSGLMVHYSFDTDFYPPSPYLESSLAGGEAFTGWYGYQIHKGETDLMLVVDELFHYDEPVLYAALTENASVETNREALNSITPTEIGLSPTDPTLFGQIATGETWQLTVHEVIRGDNAWQMAQKANQFNDPPPGGMEYVAVRLRVHYIGDHEDGENIGNYDFVMLGDDNIPYEHVSVVKPDPELDFKLFPGGEAEGWIYLQVAEGTDNLVMRFEHGYSQNDPDERYFSLVPHGR